jgi:hypothetical protein
MSWDLKKHGSKRGYYYRSVRDGDRVRKLYIGRGPQAEALARQVAERRQAKLAEQEAWQRHLSQILSAEQHLQDVIELVDQMVRVVLLGAGCHEHHGEWRRRRHGRDVHVGTSC